MAVLAENQQPPQLIVDLGTADEQNGRSVKYYIIEGAMEGMHFLIAPAAERPLGRQAKLGGGYSVVTFHG